MSKQPSVYILTNKTNGVLYVGVTANLPGRVWQHKNNAVPGFTARYNLHQLVWFELHEDMYAAITREKAIKNWKREWKIQLIESSNPGWKDLYKEIL